MMSTRIITHESYFVSSFNVYFAIYFYFAETSQFGGGGTEWREEIYKKKWKREKMEKNH